MLSLSDLMNNAARTEFLSRFTDKRRWRGSVSCREEIAALLSWERLDAALSEAGFSEGGLRIFLDEQPVAQQVYADPASGMLRTGAVPGLAEQGATLVLDAISGIVGSLANLTRGIERELGARVNCSAYLSFGERSAFLPHYDDHDVLIIHLRGTKAWRGYGYGLKFPVRRGPAQRVGPPEWEDVLEPGDLLYLPRGEIHAAIPVERPSVHLTIGIVERTGVDFVRALTEQAEAQELFRHSLTRRDMTSQESQLKQALHALVDATSLEAFFARDDQERRLKPAAAFNFAQRLEPGTVLAATLLRRLPLYPRIEREIKLVLGGQSLRLTQLERRTLDRLTRCDQATLTELAAALELDPADPSLAGALARLASHALVEIVNR